LIALRRASQSFTTPLYSRSEAAKSQFCKQDSNDENSSSDHYSLDYEPQSAHEDESKLSFHHKQPQKISVKPLSQLASASLEEELLQEASCDTMQRSATKHFD